MAEFQGIIVIHKEKGFTSHDVVAKLRGILHMRKPMRLCFILASPQTPRTCREQS